MIASESFVAIILGVSSCPRAPVLSPLPQCAKSANAFHQYLRSTLHLEDDCILNLFDSELSASDQVDRIDDWLSKTLQAAASSDVSLNVLFYYSGHGGFSRPDQSYYLAVRRTKQGAEGATSIRYSDLASIFRARAAGNRRYVILDCCYAASSVLKMQSELDSLVLDRISDSDTSTGTAVLCSSAAKLVSIAPPGELFTMFSGALLSCLENGISGGPRALSFEDIQREVAKQILVRFPGDAVRPELHVPDQSKGDPSKVPLFPNLGVATDAGQASRGPTITLRRSRAASETVTRNAIIGGIGGLAAAYVHSWPSPIGIDFKDIGGGGPDLNHSVSLLFRFSGLGVVFTLFAALIVSAMMRGERITFYRAISTYVACHIGWIFGFNSAYHVYVLLETEGAIRDVAAYSFGGIVGSVTTIFLLYMGARVLNIDSYVRYINMRVSFITVVLSGLIPLSIVLFFFEGSSDLNGLSVIFFIWQLSMVIGTSLLMNPSMGSDWKQIARWSGVVATLLLFFFYATFDPNVMRAWHTLLGRIDRITVENSTIENVAPAGEGKWTIEASLDLQYTGGGERISCEVRGETDDGERKWRVDSVSPETIELPRSTSLSVQLNILVPETALGQNWSSEVGTKLTIFLTCEGARAKVYETVEETIIKPLP